MSTPERTWAGTTLADRRATRRRQLIDAGLDLAGAGGTTAVSVRAVCRTARLTERYFYESFGDRDAFILAMYEDVAGQARDALVDAVRDAEPRPEALARAAVTAFVELIIDDPRKGSVMLLAPLADPVLGQRGTELLPAFTALIQEQLPRTMDDVDRSLIATGLLGAITNIFIRYLDGTLDVPRERLIGHCVQLLIRSSRA